MKTYQEREFDLPKIDGISEEQIEHHLKLYQGYVKHTNSLIEKIDSENNSYTKAELRRRFGFEFDGMRSHEYYFGALEGGPKDLDEESPLMKAVSEQYGDFSSLKKEIEEVAGTRGSGWTILYYDTQAEQFIVSWIDEHHLGHLSNLDVVLPIDVWEHAYMVDHPPSGRIDYVKAYLKAVNWETVNGWFEEIVS